MEKLDLPFDEIYVVHLASDLARKTLMDAELERLGVAGDVIWHNGVHLPQERELAVFAARRLPEYFKNPRVFNCWLNHYMVVRQALERGVGRILVMEDDMQFNPDIEFVRPYFDERRFPTGWGILRWNVTYFDSLVEGENFTATNRLFNMYVKSHSTRFGSCGCYALTREGMEYYVDYYERHGYQPSDYALMYSVDEGGPAHYFANTKYVCEGRSRGYNDVDFGGERVQSYIP